MWPKICKILRLIPLKLIYVDLCQDQGKKSNNSPVSKVQGSRFKSAITMKKQQQQKTAHGHLKGTRINWLMKKLNEKISWDCPFKFSPIFIFSNVFQSSPPSSPSPFISSPVFNSECLFITELQFTSRGNIKIFYVMLPRGYIFLTIVHFRVFFQGKNLLKTS